MTDLCSAVFVLELPRPFGIDKFMGRAAHKLFLLMLAQGGSLVGQGTQFADWASALHNLDATMPFTVSNLFQTDERHAWMRITALEPELSTALELLTSVLPNRAEVDGWAVRFGLTTRHEWAGQTSYEAFISQNWLHPAHERVRLEFLTPAVIKSVGVYRPFPHPSLVFKLLYERTLKVTGLELPFRPPVENVEAFAEYMIEIVDYDLACTHVGMKHPTIGFCGTAHYQFLRENDAFEKRARTRRDRDGDTSLTVLYDELMAHYEQYKRLINLLAAVLFYSGLGSGTGQGLGMGRQVDVRGG